LKDGSRAFTIIFATIIVATTIAIYLKASDTSLNGKSNDNMHLDPIAGPLKVHPSNPRYFTDGNGKAVYLTGAHTWSNLQDSTDPQEKSWPFDYTAYLDFLVQHHHNFMRLWVSENAAWVPSTTDKIIFDPLPYQRTGPGVALDSGPKFDLRKFNQAYFDRLRERIVAAGNRGIYVSVMLFQGWSIDKKPDRPGNPWPGHPFHRDNNINGLDGDLNGNGQGEEIHTLLLSPVTALQEIYVRKVIDMLNDLDNVLWEISNESHGGSTEWQYHMVNYIGNYEAQRPKQHPIGMTFQWPGGNNSDLFASSADWISPRSDGVFMDHQLRDSRKVIITDTDHVQKVEEDRIWVWKSFLKGLNPIYMDYSLESDLSREPARKAMGDTLAYSKRVNLAAMFPHSHLASTGYCLANPGSEYLIYLPSGAIIKGHGYRALRWLSRFSENKALRWVTQRGGLNSTVTVDLSATTGTLYVEWFNPSTGSIISEGTTTGGIRRDFVAPFVSDAVLYITVNKTRA
jgi:hypothetical protein